MSPLRFPTFRRKEKVDKSGRAPDGIPRRDFLKAVGLTALFGNQLLACAEDDVSRSPCLRTGREALMDGTLRVGNLETDAFGPEDLVVGDFKHLYAGPSPYFLSSGPNGMFVKNSSGLHVLNSDGSLGESVSFLNEDGIDATGATYRYIGGIFDDPNLYVYSMADQYLYIGLKNGNGSPISGRIIGGIRQLDYDERGDCLVITANSGEIYRFDRGMALASYESGVPMSGVQVHDVPDGGILSGAVTSSSDGIIFTKNEGWGYVRVKGPSHSRTYEDDDRYVAYGSDPDPSTGIAEGDGPIWRSIGSFLHGVGQSRADVVKIFPDASDPTRICFDVKDSLDPGLRHTYSLSIAWRDPSISTSDPDGEDAGTSDADMNPDSSDVDPDTTDSGADYDAGDGSDATSGSDADVVDSGSDADMNPDSSDVDPDTTDSGADYDAGDGSDATSGSDADVVDSGSDADTSGDPDATDTGSDQDLDVVEQAQINISNIEFPGGNSVYQGRKIQVRFELSCTGPVEASYSYTVEPAKPEVRAVTASNTVRLGRDGRRIVDISIDTSGYAPGLQEIVVSAREVGSTTDNTARSTFTVLEEETNPNPDSDPDMGSTDVGGGDMGSDIETDRTFDVGSTPRQTPRDPEGCAVGPTGGGNTPFEIIGAIGGLTAFAVMRRREDEEDES